MLSFTHTGRFIRCFLLAMALALGSSSAFAQNQCVDLFTETSALQQMGSLQKLKTRLDFFMSRFQSQKITAEMAQALFGSVKNLLADTTGKRVENKVTAATAVVDRAIENFRNKLATRGLELVDRDQKIAGFRNVTYTEYTQPFAVSLDMMKRFGFEVRPELIENLEDLLNVKIRLRSYGLVAEEKKTFGIKDIIFAKFTQDRVFVELKFKDPSYDGAVFKPQAYMKKEYTKLFGTLEFLTRFEEIKADTLANLKISSKKTLDQSSVENMLEYLRLGHIAKLNYSIVAVNIYERSAKSLTLKYDSTKDPDYNTVFGAVENVELQMTFDQLISLFIPGSDKNLGENQYYQAFTPTETVSEFKTPTLIAHHLKRAADEAQRAGRIGLIVTEKHAELLEKIIPGLKDYFEMIDEIMQARNQANELNRGKWGLTLKKIKSEIENTLIRLLDDGDEIEIVRP